MTACDDTQLMLGSYALGGLEPDERERVDDHLARCETCRRVHERIGGLPALLDLVEPHGRAHADPSPALEHSVMAGFGAEQAVRAPSSARRRSRRWPVVAMSALAGAAIAVAVLAGAGVLSPDEERSMRVLLRPPSGTGSAWAAADLTPGSGGTEVRLDASLPPLQGDEVYELWFAQGDGRMSAGTFRVGDDGRATVRLAAAARPGTYRLIGITREPDGADPAANGKPVVVGSP